MTLSILVDATCHSSFKTTVLLLFFCSLVCCVHEPVQLVPPSIPLPNKRFVVVRDYNTTWNALLRAVDDMKTEHVKSFHKKEGTLVLGPVTVTMEAYCDCGSLGKSPLKGQVRRHSVIKVEPNAPQETLVEISCRYLTVYNWKDRSGKVMRQETIPCISNGQFERELYHGLIRYMSP